MKRLYFQTLILIIVCLWQTMASAQTIRIEDIKKNFSKKEWFKVSGGGSASGTYYTASEMYGHLPWTFMIQGNVNFKIFNLINLPFSFNFTNSGFTYAYPNMPNRFSLHPSYKWAAAHIGDISMTYSPYTLSGHQFTGIGADLTPGKWRASVMFGRLQRAVEYDPTNNHNQQELWRINKAVLDEQLSQRKEFYFSHDPFSPKREQYFSLEIEYLIE